MLEGYKEKVKNLTGMLEIFKVHNFSAASLVQVAHRREYTKYIGSIWKCGSVFSSMILASAEQSEPRNEDE